MRHGLFSVCYAIALGAGVAVCAWAAPSGTPNWATGARLKERLAAHVTVSWSNLPLGRALAGLGAAEHVAIVLDRRVDPDRAVSLSLSQQPLATAFAEIARKTEIGYCQFGPVAYFGPPEAARLLRTLAAVRLDEIRPLGSAGARKFLVLRTWTWDELAEPRALVADLAAEADVEIVGAERIPHDLWPAADLPQLSWIDRLTLLAAEFDLAFRVESSGRKVTLIPIDKDTAVTRTYAAGRDAAKVAKAWARAIPGVQITVDKDKIRLKGRVEDHELVEQRLRGKSLDRPTVTTGPEVYQLSVESAALSKVIDQLTGRLNLQIQWDRAAIDAAGISVDQLISVKVKDASLDDLVRAVLAGTGLDFRRNGQEISIFPNPGR
jgi:hypothetical protein